MMGGAQPGAASSSRMTNGAVSGSRMTNGAVATTGSGSSLTVGSQQIQVPAGPVTILAETKQPLHVGQQIVVVAKKQSNGSFNGSDILSINAK
jgi:hypothetical protein